MHAPNRRMWKQAGVVVAGAWLCAVVPSWAGQQASVGQPVAFGAVALGTAGHVEGITDRGEDTLATLSADDARIAELVNDMHMFLGDLKIVAMEELLTAMAERQSAMLTELRQLRGDLMPRRAAEPDASSPRPGARDPWASPMPMCAPSL